MDWLQPLQFERQENARVSSHFLSPHLASDSLSTAAPFPQPLLRSFLRGGGGCTQAMLPRLLSPHISRYPLNGELVRRLLHFSLLWETIASHRHYNGSIDSKCTHTPKSICKVLTSIWPSTSKEERTKLIKLSSVTKPVNSNHLNEIYLQLLEEIAPSLRKKQPSPKLKSIPVLWRLNNQHVTSVEQRKIWVPDRIRT